MAELDETMILRLRCLLLAKGDMAKANDYFHWITTGIKPIKDRVQTTS